MRRVAVALLACLAGCGGGEKLQSPPPSAPRQLTVTSPDFPANGAIPARFSCDGEKARPALRFAGVPAGAAEPGLVVVDPDAGGFVHWTAYALAPDTRALDATGLRTGRLRPRVRTARVLAQALDLRGRQPAMAAGGEVAQAQRSEGDAA